MSKFYDANLMGPIKTPSTAVRQSL